MAQWLWREKRIKTLVEPAVFEEMKRNPESTMLMATNCGRDRDQNKQGETVSNVSSHTAERERVRSGHHKLLNPSTSFVGTFGPGTDIPVADLQV